MRAQRLGDLHFGFCTHAVHQQFENDEFVASVLPNDDFETHVTRLPIFEVCTHEYWFAGEVASVRPAGLCGQLFDDASVVRKYPCKRRKVVVKPVRPQRYAAIALARFQWI